MIHIFVRLERIKFFLYFNSMNQSVMLVLVISLIIIITIVVLKPLEKYNNYNNKVVLEGTTTNSDALFTGDRDFVKHIVEIILDNINKNYNRKFVLGNLEGIQVLPNNDGTDRYIVKCFIYNTNNYVNRKFVFDFKLDMANGFIDINRIYFGSSQNPVLERSPISGRGSTLYKPKNNLKNMIENVSETELHNSDFVKDPEVKNFSTDPKERVSDIKNPLEEVIPNVFPCRIVHHLWDSVGLMKVECPDLKKKCLGPYSGTRPPFKVPEFNPTIFEGDSSLYHDMFDMAQDAASRPVGIG